MDIIKPAKVTILQTDGDGAIAAISHLQEGQAQLLLCREDMSWEDENPGLVSLNADECKAMVEKLQGSKNSARANGAEHDIKMTVSRDNRGEPYREGFSFSVSDNANTYPDHLHFFIEDGYYLDRMIEVLQHCVQMEKDIVAHMQNSVTDPGL